jgi:glutaredoxin 3
MPTVKMYTTAFCPFCIQAKQLLRARGVENIDEIRIDQDLKMRNHMMEETGQRTVPQIYIGDKHIGGYDQLRALDTRGELTPLLNPN